MSHTKILIQKGFFFLQSYLRRNVLSHLKILLPLTNIFF